MARCGLPLARANPHHPSPRCLAADLALRVSGRTPDSRASRVPVGLPGAVKERAESLSLSPPPSPVSPAGADDALSSLSGALTPPAAGVRSDRRRETTAVPECAGGLNGLRNGAGGAAHVKIMPFKNQKYDFPHLRRLLRD